jgi:hypothetical protein
MDSSPDRRWQDDGWHRATFPAGAVEIQRSTVRVVGCDSTCPEGC